MLIIRGEQIDAFRAKAQLEFEQLLVKTNGKWRVLMERQFAEVTQDAWDKLPK